MTSSLSSELFNAILSMDAYNRGYDASIDLGVKDKNGNYLSIGNATIDDDKGDAAAQSIGFYALAYSYDGSTIISFRGTDNAPSLFNPLPSV
ncbi:MAG: hypothetical protein IT559_04385 [Alphaproteobacteria bacterium]|nr:hypothetical protein [Alphaproteobacteria bacterium]